MGKSAANDRLDYERVGRFIYSFHRICGSVEALADVGLASEAPPELAQRAANLAAKFQRTLENIAHMAEGELELTLREAADVQAAIDEWRIKGSRL